MLKAHKSLPKKTLKFITPSARECSYDQELLVLPPSICQGIRPLRPMLLWRVFFLKLDLSIMLRYACAMYVACHVIERLPATAVLPETIDRV